MEENVDLENYSIKDSPIQEKKKRKYIKWTKAEMDTYGVKIAEYRLQGLTFERIAELMGMTKGRVHYLYKHYSERFIKENLKIQATLLTEYHKRMEYIWRTHLAKYNQTIRRDENGNVVDMGDVRVLKEAGKLLSDHFDRLQSAGFLPKIKDKIEIKTNEKPLSADDFVKAYMEFKKKEKKEQK